MKQAALINARGNFCDASKDTRDRGDEKNKERNWIFIKIFEKQKKKNCQEIKRRTIVLYLFHQPLSHSLMPTACPIKTNPVHSVWKDERSQLREDVVWSRTVVKKDYIGNLFRPSKRFLVKKEKKKVVRSKRKKNISVRNNGII